MKNFSTWLLIMFVIMFWGFRIIVAVMAELGRDLQGIEPLNLSLEVVLLFVVLVCIILIVKRKMIGALIYLLAYGMYFGTNVFNNIQIILSGGEGASSGVYLNVVVSIIGIILPVCVLLDLVMDQNRKKHPKDKKTDWFYANEKFDRKLDDRADKNNYRTM